MLEFAFQIAAAVIALAAAYFVWQGDRDWAFVCGTFAVVALFLGYRTRLRARTPAKSRPAPPAETEQDEVETEGR